MKKIIVSAVGSLIILFTSCSIIDIDDIMADAGVGPYVLNGTWVQQDPPVGLNGFKQVFYNGNLERLIDGLPEPIMKGSYYTNKKILTMNITHVHGTFVSSILTPMGAPVGDMVDNWYTKEELENYFLSKSWGSIPMSQFLNLFGESTASYSVSGNKLILTYEHEEIYEDIFYRE